MIPTNDITLTKLLITCLLFPSVLLVNAAGKTLATILLNTAWGQGVIKNYKARQQTK